MNLISVITPVFNAEKYIETCILNVVEQQSLGIEHLIIDGGSTDNTVEIIKKYAIQYSHIKWISEKDNGQSDAMNKGVKMASGKFISFLNVDDTYEKEILAHWKNLINTTDYMFYSGNCNVYDSNSDFVYVSKPRQNTFFTFYFKQTYPINPCSYFYRRSIHDTIGYYNSEEHFCMDLDFILRYMNRYKSYYYEDKVWGNFYLTETSKTFNDNSYGNTQVRKKELFKSYWKKNNFFIRYFLILRNKLIDHL